MPLRVKSENKDSLSAAAAAATESLPLTWSSSGVEDVTMDLTPMELDDDSEINEDDEIVREINVYLSPELSKNLHLMQFPLQRQHGPSLGRRDKPKAARIKPRHCMVELDYSTRPGIDDDDDEDMMHNDDNGQFSLSTRTFSSQTIPVSTHMALGKIVADGSAAPGLHLIPLIRITQMRPNFEHVNEATLHLSSTGGDDHDPHNNNSPSLDATGTSRRPLTFQKKESERAAMARKSSYAYKKGSEESEVWIPLEIHAEQTVQSEWTLEKVACRTPDQNLLLPIPKYEPTVATGHPFAAAVAVAGEVVPIASNANAASSAIVPVPSSSLSSYVQSLNYLPQQPNNRKAGDKSEAIIGIMGDLQQEPQDMMSTVVGRMVELMHQGWPIPFSVLRDRFDSSVYSDQVLLQALNVCAFMVRGNFILQSRLMPLSSAVGQARTFFLFLLQSLGVLHRARLEHVYHGDKQVTPEVIFMLLQQIGTRGPEAGWKLKVDDDPSLQTNHPGVVELHMEFWRKQVRRFQPLFEYYRQIPQDNDNGNIY